MVAARPGPSSLRRVSLVKLDFSIVLFPENLCLLCFNPIMVKDVKLVVYQL